MRLNTRRSARTIVGAAVLAAASLAGLAPGAGAAQTSPPNDRARGLVWDGLLPAQAGSRCAGLFEVCGRAAEVLGCTHGPDPAPEGVDARTPVATATLA